MKRPEKLVISRKDLLGKILKTEYGKEFCENTSKINHEWRMKKSPTNTNPHKIDLFGEYDHKDRSTKKLEDCAKESGVISETIEVEFTDKKSETKKGTNKKNDLYKQIYDTSVSDPDIVKRYFHGRGVTNLTDEIIEKYGLKVNRYKAELSVVIPIKSIDGELIQIQTIKIDPSSFKKIKKVLHGSATKDRGLFLEGKGGASYIVEGIEDGLSCYLHHNSNDSYLVTFGTSGFNRVGEFITNGATPTILHDSDKDHQSIKASFNLGQLVDRKISTMGILYDSNQALQDGKLTEWFETLRSVPWEEVMEVSGQVPKFNLTEMGNGERLAFHRSNDYKYCAPKKSWFKYTGKYWEKDINGSVTTAMRDITRKIPWDEEQDDEDWLKQAVGHSMKSESVRSNKASVEAARALIPLPIDDLDNSSYVYNCQNGTLDLKTGILNPHDRKDYLTRLVDIEYDPNAKCPEWLKFLKTIFVDDELIDYIQKAVGYSLTGEISEQCLHFMHGHGSNGKSTFTNMMIKICQPYYEKIRVETLKNSTGLENSSNASPDIAKLKGSRLVIASEIQHRMKFNSTLAKDMTGGEQLTGRFLHENEIKFTPQFKLWLYGNHKPIILENDFGIWRRIRLIPFEVTITDPDKDLPKKLESEAIGVLSWAVEGCLKWQSEGLKVPGVIEEATEKYKQDMDSVGRFIKERFKTDMKGLANESIEFRERTTHLHDKYTAWFGDVGEVGIPKKAFQTIMIDKGFPVVKKGGNYYYYNLRAKTAAEDKKEEKE